MARSSEAYPHGVCVVVAYDGSDFAGYQVQPGARTVQAVLEAAAQVLTGHPVRVRGAGRTDAGVHALGQVVAFDSARDISTRGFLLGLNSNLPRDVRIQEVTRVAAGYDPRHDSLAKTYRYLVQLGERQNPLLRQRAWQLGKHATLDFVAMRAAATRLVGTHDFRAFRSADDARENNVRTMYSIDLMEQYTGDPTLFAIEVRGTAFMKNMVRIMVGTLVDIGRGRLALDDVPGMLGAEANRDLTGFTAPAHGLTMVNVELGRKARMLELGMPVR
ncbi:MAG: tRNA pseudouridine(38-40) synthase TruA [Polyangiales bacterium]